MMPSAKVFISYCREDKWYLDRLLRHFVILERDYLIEMWDDDRIGKGRDWQVEIERAITSADSTCVS